MLRSIRKDGVQGLDGDARRHRKQMFIKNNVSQMLKLQCAYLNRDIALDICA